MTAVPDGEAALEAADERTPAIAVLDVSMRRMDDLDQPLSPAVPVERLSALRGEGKHKDH